MLLTITTTHSPATDLGFLLHKNPGRCHSFDLSFGKAYVFYPEATPERCTAALLLEVDPVGLVRGRGPAAFSLEQYVNDRPYVASSFLSVALNNVFRTAMTGRSKDRPDLVDSPLPLVARLSVVPCRGGDAFLKRLFEPLGYTVITSHLPLDPRFPEWGESSYFSVELQGNVLLRDMLAHIYVLIPVLDNDKHYYIGDDEVEKLLRHGAGWLAGHPDREAIADRYLKHKRTLAREALARLVEESPDPDADAREHGVEEEVAERQLVPRERQLSLHDQRLGSVLAVLKDSGAHRVLDLGCGEGKLIRLLLNDPQFQEILGVDVSHRVLELASDRLRLDRLAPRQQERIRLMQGSLTYRDRRLEGYDAAAVVEVIEHLDPARLAAFERSLFEFARPGSVVVTTPNVEYNIRFETLPAGKLRHKDHRFEWSRSEFQSWAQRVADTSGYNVRFLPVGPEDPTLGAPTQMAVFRRADPAAGVQL